MLFWEKEGQVLKTRIRLATELTGEEREFVKGVARYNATWYVFTIIDDKLVSRVGVIERIAKVNEQPIRLGAIGGVETLENYRGQGCGSAAMRMAAKFIQDELKVEFGILTTYDNIAPFYQQLGWEKAPGPFISDESEGKVVHDGITMILPCLKDRWPEGAIDFCGPAF